MSASRTATVLIRRWYVFWPCLALCPVSFYLALAVLEVPVYAVSLEVEASVPFELERTQHPAAGAAREPVIVVPGSDPGHADLRALAGTLDAGAERCEAAAAEVENGLLQKSRRVIQERLLELQETSALLQWERRVLEEAHHRVGAAENKGLLARAIGKAREGERVERATRRLEFADPAMLVKTTFGGTRARSNSVEEHDGRSASALLGVWLSAALVASAAAYFFDRCDSRFRSADDVARRLRLPVFGALPRVQPHGVPVSPNKMPVKLARAVLSTANVLHEAVAASQLRSLLFTSALPREGKSTAAASLAAALAARGLKIILVDADLRQPSLHKILGLRNEVGLSNLMEELSTGHGTAFEREVRMDDTRVRRVLQTTGIPNLSLVSAGRINSSASILLEREVVQPLILRFCRMADLVICDSRAILEARDALALAASVDGTVLVLAVRETDAHEVEWARRLLLEAQASLLGVIANYSSGPRTGGVDPPNGLEPCLEQTAQGSRITS